MQGMQEISALPNQCLRFRSAPSGSVQATSPPRIRLQLFKCPRFVLTHFIPRSALQAKEHFIYGTSLCKMPLDPFTAVALAGNVIIR